MTRYCKLLYGMVNAYGRGTARGAVEVRSWCGRGAVEVRSRYTHGTVEDSRYARGTVLVSFQFASGSVRFVNGSLTVH